MYLAQGLPPPLPSHSFANEYDIKLCNYMWHAWNVAFAPPSLRHSVGIDASNLFSQALSSHV
jgi:hypothetical protein